MTLVIVGAAGNIGRRLMTAFPGSVGIDRHIDADIVADLATADYDSVELRLALESATGLVHVATDARPNAPAEIHFATVTAASRLVEACLRYRVPRLVLPSSGWADPKPGYGPINPYGHSKRVFEAMAAMYVAAGLHAKALRFGWVPRDPREVEAAPPELRADYWNDTRLIAEVKAALGFRPDSQ